MHPYQQRVIDEKSELDERVKRLIAFKISDGWQKIPVGEQSRMIRQLLYMEQYSRVLEERIAAFQNE